MKLTFDSPLSVTIRNTKDGKQSVTVDVLGGSFFLPREACPADLHDGTYTRAELEVQPRNVKTDFGPRTVFGVVRLLSVK